CTRWKKCCGRGSPLPGFPPSARPLAIRLSTSAHIELEPLMSSILPCGLADIARQAPRGPRCGGHLPARINVRAEKTPVTVPATTTGREGPAAPSASPAPPRPSSVRRHDHPSGGAAPSLLRGLDRR